MWKTKTFGELVVSKGTGLERKASLQSADKDFPYLKMNNITNNNGLDVSRMVSVDANSEEIKKYRLNKNDFLFNTRNSVELVGKSAVFEDDKLVLFNNNILRVKFINAVNAKYVNYFLTSASGKRQLNKVKSGTTNVAAIYYKDLQNIEILLPPLAEQQRIVAKLDAAFAEIDGAIEAVKNQDENTKNFLDSTLEELFNNKEYEEHSMDDVCTFVGGSQPPKSEFEYEKSENNIRLIQIRDYKSDKHIVFIPKDKARRFCNQSDVMIGRYGPPIFQILRGIEGSYNVALMKAIPKENILNDYLFYFLKNRKIQNFVINKSTRAAGQSGVNKDALEPYVIHLPSLDIQKAILNNSKNIETQSTQLSNIYKRKLENLLSLKSAILAQELQSEAA
jgi:type I restriction enzyme, S subunit